MTSQEIRKRFIDNGYSFTKNPFRAIFIFPDGQMVDGDYARDDYKYKNRGNDHRCIEVLMDDIDRYDPNFWEEAHKRFDIVQIVPETKILLVLDDQKLTPQQLYITDILEGAGYKLQNLK